MAEPIDFKFMNILNLRARIAENGHMILLSFDRIACPLNGRQGLPPIKEAMGILLDFAKTLPPAEGEKLKAMVTKEVGLAVQEIIKSESKGSN